MPKVANVPVKQTPAEKLVFRMGGKDLAAAAANKRTKLGAAARAEQARRAANKLAKAGA